MRSGALKWPNVDEAAEPFNKAGRAFKAVGIRFGYRPHGYEFRPLTEGRTEICFGKLLAARDP